MGQMWECSRPFPLSNLIYRKRYFEEYAQNLFSCLINFLLTDINMPNLHFLKWKFGWQRYILFESVIASSLKGRLAVTQ